MIHYRHMLTAMLVSIGKLPDGSYSPRNVVGLAEQSLDQLATAIDSAQDASRRYVANVQRDAERYLERLAAGCYYDDAPFTAHHVGDANSAAAKARVLIEMFGPLFSEIGGLPFTMAAQVVIAQLAEPTSYDATAWITECAALFSLARAMHEQEQALAATRKRIAQDTAEAEALARVEAKNAAKAEAKAQRAADRKGMVRV